MITHDSAQIIQLLNQGEVCALPTETVYGLAARVDDENAIQKIFKIKNRPLNDPLIIHVSSVEMSLRYIDLNNDQKSIFTTLVNKFWPGPLTIVVEKNKNLVKDIITSDENTVAIRMPNKEITRQIIQALDCGLAAPSANPFKKTSPTSSQHVEKYFPNIHILEGGQSEKGIESTIIKINNNSITILRPGSINENDFKKLNIKILDTNIDILRPGDMQDHYQPKHPLYLALGENDLKKIKDETSFDYEIKLSENVKEAEAQIYNKLHELDSKKIDNVLIFINNDKVNRIEWRAIIDRLRKASTNY